METSEQQNINNAVAKCEQSHKEFVEKLKNEMQNTYCGRGIGLRTKMALMKVIDKLEAEPQSSENFDDVQRGVTSLTRRKE